jgi:lysophospholipase L1-like esterase
MKPIPLLLSLICVWTPISVLRAQTDIGADDPNIQYVGRFDRTTPGAPAFDWSAACISAKFQGSSCAIKLGGASKYFDVYVDGVKTGSIKRASGGVETVPVASGLADTVHSVALYRRDEASKGLNTFQGFVLDSGKALVAPDARPCRKMEFVGDSFTCGYGDEAAFGTSFSYATENACITYAALMANRYQADYMVTAWSGKGMVRNYGAATQISTDPLPYYYTRTCGSVATNNYAFTWQPDVVVVALGINDFSTSPNPSQAQYVGGYSNFVKTLRGYYPNAHIICTYLASMAGAASSYIRTVVNTSGDSKVHFASVSYTLLNPTDLGSDWHPNASGQTKIANAFIPVFDGIMGTNWGSAPHGTPLMWLRAYGFTNDFAAAEESDPDGDRMKTWEEYLAGTDPTNGASVFRFQEIAPVGAGVKLTWSGTTNGGATTPFRMYRTTNLLSPSWDLASDSIPRAANGINVWTDAAPILGGQRFYRLAVPAR